jgi:hypothetical protein
MNPRMSIFKFDKCVVIEEKVIKGRIEQFYEIINETIDEPDLDKMIFATLHNRGPTNKKRKTYAKQISP